MKLSRDSQCFTKTRFHRMHWIKVVAGNEPEVIIGTVVLIRSTLTFVLFNINIFLLSYHSLIV